MIPSPDDIMLQIPVTLDYKGGRSENGKNKWILLAVVAALTIIISLGIGTNDDLALWKKWLFLLCFWYVILIFIRFYAFKEMKYSDIYETLKETRNELPLNSVWNIFDIEWEYPYIAYFRNGKKGIFVKMEKGAITGKGEQARYDHYEAISDAYNLAHSLNMDIRHIDYMDNVGNDSRLQNLYDQLKDVSNPDMEDLLIELYDNLAEEMSRNYSSFDIYLYLTRDKTESFIYNVQMVSNTMLGGNFITYRVLDRDDIRTVCMALYNLHDFSVSDACEDVLRGQRSHGIVPIKLISVEDGTEQKLNKTQAELDYEEEQRRLEYEAELAERKRNKKARHKRQVEEQIEVSEEDEVDLFN